MLTEKELRTQAAAAVTAVHETTPLAGSITNFVTIDFVANAQLAVGGSAAMVYLPDEGTALAIAGQSMYINVGTLLPVHERTVPAAMVQLHRSAKPWVLDPVAVGLGELRTKLLSTARNCPPAIIRGNASEIIALAGPERRFRHVTGARCRFNGHGPHSPGRGRFSGTFYGRCRCRIGRGRSDHGRYLRTLL